MKSEHQPMFDELVLHTLDWEIIQNFRNTSIKMEPNYKQNNYKTANYHGRTFVMK